MQSHCLNYATQLHRSNYGADRNYRQDLERCVMKNINESVTDHSSSSIVYKMLFVVDNFNLPKHHLNTIKNSLILFRIRKFKFCLEAKSVR
jgi:hypothetical protein